MRVIVWIVALFTFGTASAEATTIYPVDRATILAGSRFDLKVEFDRRLAAGDARVTVNGVDHAQALGRPAAFVEQEDGHEASALILRDVVLDRPGIYAVTATDGRAPVTVTWTVFAAEGPRKARNVILFIGDGMSAAHRTAARILGKGVMEGRYRG